MKYNFSHSEIESWDRGRIDAVIEWLLIGLLAFMPLAFGAVEAWSEMVTFLLVAAMCLCLALKYCLRRGFRIVWTWEYVPIFLFLLLVVFQLLPLPNDLVARLSPETAQTKTSLLSDLSGNPALERTTLSFYPYATKHGLRLALTAACVFFVVLQVFRRPEQIKRLLAAIAAIGFAFAVLALLQVLSGATEIYWTVARPFTSVATAGSFINHSNYSQFMNLSIGAAVALLLVRLEETARAQRRSGSLGSVIETVRESSTGWLLAMIAIGGITVFTSLSRNGVISLVIAATLTGILLALKRKLQWRGWLLAVVPLVAFGGLLMVGFDAVYERLATVQDLENDWRWEMTRCALDAWRHYPVWGMGLGTHEMVFPMFDTATIASLAVHADNDYAQMIEETGLVGAILFVVFLTGIWWRYGRLVWKGKSPLAMAAFGLGFGLLAVMIHSATDFGQHLPANFCLSAVACGLLVAIAKMEGSGSGVAAMEAVQGKAPKWRRLVMAIALIGLVAGWGWVLREANATRLGERDWNHVLDAEAKLRQNNWQGTDDDYVELIRNAAEAAERVPDNVKYRYWLNLYRWYSISRVVDPETGRVLLHPQAGPFVERIADELAQARILCPTYGAIYSVEGQLRLSFLKQPLGVELIRKGYQLSPYDAPTCFVAGTLAARTGDLETAATILKRAIALDGSLYRQIVPIYLDELDRPDMLRDLAGDDYGRLLTLARLLATNQKYLSLAGEIRTHAKAILSKCCESSDATANELATLAGIYQADHDYVAAVEYYRRALVINYDQVGWRMNLARALVELDQCEAAMHEARICLRLRPHMKSAENLVKNLSVRTKQ